MVLKVVPKSNDIPRAKLIELKARIEREKETQAMNLNASIGAIQAIEMLLKDEPVTGTK